MYWWRQVKNKNRHPATAFKRPAGEANRYVWFEYGLLKIFNHTQGNFSGSMNANPINVIHKIQQSTKERLQQRTWRRFWINQRNQLKQTSMNNQPVPLPQPSTNLPGGNPYVRFGYSPQKIFNHTLGQVSGSMNSDPINVNKHVNNQLRKDDN